MATTHAWLQHAKSCLRDAKGAATTGTVTITVRDESGAEVTYRLPAVEYERTAALSPLEERIVDAVAAAGVLTAKAIAARLTVSNDGGFRAILANLCERQPPPLVSGHDGYRLAEAPRRMDP